MVSSDIKSQVAIGEATSEFAATQKKVLIIDDDPVMIKVLTVALNSKGYAVYSARGGAEAIGIVRKESPDMLLVDVHLFPDGGVEAAATWDGFQVTRWLRHVSAKMIPAIIISAMDKPDYQKFAEKIGASTFMSKPLNTAMLFQSIESALAGTTSNNPSQKYA